MSQLKLIIAIVLATILGLGGWYMYHQHQEIKEKDVLLISQKLALDAYALNAVKVQKSVAVTDEVVTNVVVDTRKVDSTSAKIVEKTDSKEGAIRKKYKALLETEQAKPKDKFISVTPPDYSQLDKAIADKLKAMESAEISDARIEGVWEVFCSTNPNDSECKPPILIEPAPPPPKPKPAFMNMF